MSFPRECLDFASWYLKSKGYISVQDNSDFELTAAGVDFVESNFESNPVLHRLLRTGSRTFADSDRPSRTPESGAAEERHQPGPASDPNPKSSFR
jgi:hypothetical protein